LRFGRCALLGAAIFGIAVLAAGRGTPLAAGTISAVHAQANQGPPGFADIVDRVKPAVISVRVRISGAAAGDNGNTPAPGETPFDRFSRQFGAPDNGNQNVSPGEQIIAQGSGFFISADGYAVTNNHVVETVDSARVTTDDGKSYTAKVVGKDDRTDIALIKVDGRKDFPFVTFAAGMPRIGDWVLAVGNPFGLGGTVTAGIVSARGRDIGEGPYDDFIQIDAPVNQGNSGGPTFNMAGDVIGVNTAIFTPSGGSVGIAFAVPADTVKAVVSQLKEKGIVTRGYIGVQIQQVTLEIADSMGLKEARGALVAEPDQNGPAVKAGIEAGDVITAINGKQVADSRDFARTISGLAPGSVVKLTLLRSGQEKTVSVTLATLPNQRQANLTPGNQPQPRGTNLAQLGLTVASQPDGQGVIVIDVSPNGVAADHGFKNGDVILEAGGKKVGGPGDVSAALTAAQKEGKRSVLLRVRSSDGTRYVALPLRRG
jgi:serine protease Do